jgi:hypothetical protein
MNTTSIQPPGGTADAPGLAATLNARLQRASLAVWRTLEAYGHVRAMREMQNLHDRWEVTDPELARQLREGSAFLLQQRQR